MEDFSLEQLTFTIQLNWVSYNFIRFSPFFWLVIPSFQRRGRGNGRKEMITYHYYKENGEIGQDGHHHRKYQQLICVRWLCIELQFAIYRLTDIGKIYPKNYDPEKEPVTKRLERWEALLKTDFFN